MLTVFIVGAIICGYLAVALAVYILLLRFTDFDADFDITGMALLWPVTLLLLAISIVCGAVLGVFLEIEKQIRGKGDEE